MVLKGRRQAGTSVYTIGFGFHTVLENASQATVTESRPVPQGQGGETLTTEGHKETLRGGRQMLYLMAVHLSKLINLQIDLVSGT